MDWNTKSERHEGRRTCRRGNIGLLLAALLTLVALVVFVNLQTHRLLLP
jgi:hypothetical protein